MPRTGLEFRLFAILISDQVRQAKAAIQMVLVVPGLRAWLRYWRSLAWWQGRSLRPPFDPVGEIHQPIVTGPNRIPLFTEESSDDDRQEVVAEAEGEKGMGAAIAIGGPRSGGSTSSCRRD
jgi:hypothetical protein